MIHEVLDCPCDLGFKVAQRAMEKYEATGKTATVMRISPSDKKYAEGLHQMTRFKHLLLQIDPAMKEDSWYIGDEKEGFGSVGA